MTSKETELESIERELLLEAVFLHYGYDFRDYAVGSLRRRLLKAQQDVGVATFSGLQEKVLHDRQSFAKLLHALTVNVTDFFRDPYFFQFFRERIIPILKTYPFVRIWHAGCSTGEEVYSMAIMLIEEGLYPRCKIYATDINDVVLDQARSGIFPLKKMKKMTANYHAAGGRNDFSTYYIAQYGHAVFKKSLKKNITFSLHNLASDTVFNEFNVILCRNVMIYFNRTLQNRVHRLFFDSLAPLGYLILGEKENLSFTRHENDYQKVDHAAKIFRRRQ